MDRVAVVHRHSGLVMRSGGVLLIDLGLLQISGVWGGWLNALRAWMGAYGTVLGDGGRGGARQRGTWSVPASPSICASCVRSRASSTFSVSVRFGRAG